MLIIGIAILAVFLLPLTRPDGSVARFVLLPWNSVGILAYASQDAAIVRMP
jgi:hypothetical protein